MASEDFLDLPASEGAVALTRKVTTLEQAPFRGSLVNAIDHRWHVAQPPSQQLRSDGCRD